MTHENPGAGRSDQARRLRELVNQRSRRAVTVAITSGKGGVGKTSVAVNLSVCLASHGLRVTLVDVDLGLANADLLLNISPRYTLSHVLTGVRSIEEVCTAGPAGIRFVPGASGCDDLADISEFERHNLLRQLQKLCRSADIVVLDCGAGISRNVVRFAQSSDCLLVVTTPQPTAMTDAYATVKVLHRAGYGGRMCLFVNMAASRADAASAYGRLAGVAQRFLNYAIADGGYMLQDAAVELAVKERVPFVIRYPASNASVCIAAMAERIIPIRSRSSGRESLLKRVAGLFV